MELLVNDKGGNDELKGAIQELKKVCFGDALRLYILFRVLWQVHPYEEVAYDVYRLETF